MAFGGSFGSAKLTANPPFAGVSPEISQDLPFDLLRSHIYPRNPKLTAQAVEEYGQPQPTYLPQKFAFRKWKTPPWVVAWSQPAQALLRARAQASQQIAAMQTIRPPTTPLVAAPAVLGADRLPQPSDNISPNLYRPTISPDVTPADELISAEDLNELTDQVNSGAVINRNNIADQRNRALMAAQGQIDQMARYIHGDANRQDEWFRRR